MCHLLSRRTAIIGALAFGLPVQAQDRALFGGGLTARIPAGFAAQTDAGALHVTQTAAVRAPLRLTLRVDPDFSLHRRWLPNRRGDIRYTILNAGGAGSGGPVQELRATRQLSDGTPLALLAQLQAEFRPDFEAALTMLSSVHRPPQ